jgi:hypothetical protein
MTPTPQEKFWSSVDEDSLEDFTNHGDLSSDITPENAPQSPSLFVKPEEIAKRLLAYVTGSRS